MQRSLAALAFSTCLTSQSIAANVTAPYLDATREIAVTFSYAGEFVVFSAALPTNYTFFVRLDGDQDGQWGDGPKLLKDVQRHPTPDWQVGYDPRDGTYCTQYILASRPDDPSRAFATWVCGSFKSAGKAEVKPDSRAGRVQIRYLIPAQELFGTLPDAHLQICVTDGARTDCQHSPAKPFVLRRQGGDIS